MNTTNNTFNAGELTPLLTCRLDIEKRASGCKKLENFLVLEHGGITKRPGINTVSGIPAGNARFIHFQYSATDVAIIVLTDCLATIFMNDAAVQTVATKWTGDMLSEIRYVQVNSVGWIVSSITPYQIKWNGETFSFVEFPFTFPPLGITGEVNDIRVRKANGWIEVDSKTITFNDGDLLSVVGRIPEGELNVLCNSRGDKNNPNIGTMLTESNNLSNTNVSSGQCVKVIEGDYILYYTAIKNYSYASHYGGQKYPVSYPDYFRPGYTGFSTRESGQDYMEVIGDWEFNPSGIWSGTWAIERKYVDGEVADLNWTEIGRTSSIKGQESNKQLAGNEENLAWFRISLIKWNKDASVFTEARLVRLSKDQRVVLRVFNDDTKSIYGMTSFRTSGGTSLSAEAVFSSWTISSVGKRKQNVEIYYGDKYIPTTIEGQINGDKINIEASNGSNLQQWLSAGGVIRWSHKISPAHVIANYSIPQRHAQAYSPANLGGYCDMDYRDFPAGTVILFDGKYFTFVRDFVWSRDQGELREPISLVGGNKSWGCDSMAAMYDRLPRGKDQPFALAGIVIQSGISQKYSDLKCVTGSALTMDHSIRDDGATRTWIQRVPINQGTQVSLHQVDIFDTVTSRAELSPKPLQASVVHGYWRSVEHLDTYDVTLAAFSSRNGYPSAIAFHQGRLWFGGTAREPQTVWASRVDDYSNFETDANDDSALKFSFLATTQDRIKWIIPSTNLLVGTESSEWSIRNSNDKAITASSFQITKHSSYGSSDVVPFNAGTGVIYVQKGSVRMQELSYDWGQDTWVSQDMTLLAEHIGKRGFRTMAYQRIPQPIIWCVLKDGGLVGCTYNREQNVIAWHRHSLADGAEVMDVVVTSEMSNGELSGAECVWLICKKNGENTVRKMSFTHQTHSDDQMAIRSEMVSLPLDLVGNDGSTLGRKKRLASSSFRVTDGSSAFASVEGDPLQEVRFDNIEDGWTFHQYESGHHKEVCPIVAHEAGEPFTLIGIVNNWEVGQ